ncbi:MAG TPA: HAD family hydrolase [Acidimicrobiales bacterium]|nr:HAD family hydrolase [Acidimicrobiales bacterium]
MAAGDLVVTDLDGTLWHLENDLHPASLAALRELMASDTPLLVATGRRRGAALRPLQPLDILPPAVVLNGAIGVDLATGERFRRQGFTPDAAVAVLDAFRAVGLDPCLYVDEEQHEVVVSESPSTSREHLESLVDAVRPGDLDQIAREEPVFMFSLIGLPHGQLVVAAEKIGARAETHVDRSFDVPGMATMTAAPAGLSKWDGVEAWCRHTGYRPERVIALGDGPNDVELLARADLALVPENGHPAAVELADFLIPPPDQGGWASLLGFL